MSHLFKSDQVLHLSYKTIDRAHFALFGLFLPFLNTFLILCAGPHDHQNDTLHTIYLDDTSLLFHNKKLFVARAGSRKRCKIVKVRPKIAKKWYFNAFRSVAMPTCVIYKW